MRLHGVPKEVYFSLLTDKGAFAFRSKFVLPDRVCRHFDIYVIVNNCINYFARFPSMKEEHVIQAHPANCICIKFHPNGHQFAVGAADAVVSLWYVC